MPTFINNVTSAVSDSWGAATGLIEIVCIIALAITAAMFFAGGGRSGERAAVLLRIIGVIAAIMFIGAASAIVQWALAAG